MQTQMVKIPGDDQVAPLREVLKEAISTFHRAQKRGDIVEMEKSADFIDSLQRQCEHPPYKIEMRQARIDHPKDAFQKGAHLTICFECNRLLAIRSVPYRYSHDSDESFKWVREALQRHDSYLDGPWVAPSSTPPEEEVVILNSLDVRAEEPHVGKRMAGVGLDKGFLSKVNKPVADALMYLAGHVDAQASRIEELEEELEKIHSRVRLLQS